MSLKKLSLFVLCLLVIGCVKYRTRYFVEENPRTIVRNFAIRHTLDSRGDPYTGVEFDGNEYWYQIDITPVGPDSMYNENLTAIVLDEIRDIFVFDSCIIGLRGEGSETNLVIEKVTPYEGLKYFRVSYYFGTLEIPSEVNTLDVRFYYHSVDSLGKRISEDTLDFELHRREGHFTSTS